MMSYVNETDFVIENKELVYPEIITDGLQLYYDAKGKRDTDYHRDTMLDMSGNKNHGTLQNFAYEKHSGYKDGLVFDYIDDKLVRPALNLQPNDFTFMLNGNIISFSPDGTVKRVQDGEVIESKGFNMVRNGDFGDGMSRWNKSTLTDVRVTKGLATVRVGQQYGGITHNLHSPSRMPLAGEKYYFCANFERESSNIHLILNDGRNQTYAVGPMIGLVSGIRTLADNPTALIVKLQDNRDKNWTDAKISDIIVINLTETFGVGNEPTIEQMDEIINRFGFIPNAQDLIDRIEYKGNDLGDMENIIDGLYKTDVLSAEEIYTDQSDDAVVHVEIDGKSVGGGSGKNLIIGTESNDWQRYGAGEYSIKTYESGDRIIRAEKGNAINAWGVQQSGNSQKMILETGEIYRVSFDVRGDVSVLNYVYIMNVGTANENISSTTLTVDSKNAFNRVSATFMKRDSTAKHSYLMISTQKQDGTWFEVKNIQIEKSSNSIIYEPPAPNPNYPVEIHSLNDFDMVSSKGRRNLSISSPNRIINDVTHDYGVRQAGFGDFELDASQPYTISFDLKVDKGAKYLHYNYLWSLDPDYLGNAHIGHISVIDDNQWHRYSHTFSFPQKRFGTIRIGFDSRQPGIDSGVPFSYKNLKVEKGNGTSYNVAPKLAPYDIVENDVFKTNILLDEPLRSVGDVRDKLFRDNDGLWKVERNIREVELTNDTGPWNRTNVGSVIVYGLYLNDLHMTDDTIATSTHYKSIPYSSRTSLIEWGDFYSTLGGERFYIAHDGFSSVSEYTSWLNSQKNSGNPVKIIYQTIDVSIEILDQELQDKLNNLQSFQDSNYIYTVLPNESNYLSDKLKPTLHAKFLYNNWYKEDRVVNNLMIYNRALTNEEMLQNYKTIKRRWGM